MGQFDIPKLIQQYFGLQGMNAAGQAFSVLDIAESLTGSALYDPYKPIGPGQKFSGITSLSQPIEVAKSISGMPIFEQFTFTQEENGEKTLDYTFPGWPLMVLDLPFKIVKTEVTANKGTVKDFIGESDMDICLRGLLINDTAYDIPLDQIVALKAACSTGKTIKVTSRVLNAIDVHYMVIERLTFLEAEGNLQVQPFYIEALSDYPVDVIIQEPGSQPLTAQQQARALLLAQ